ncbi:sugar phosphate isomerase/epimerase family protein [Alginatibacterium sediminis]|uniref:sugar phosphate isomerase/epimerase family protein n=1 Tax=Alginatibacterium sediminis TaxID=2164068 RepID=UPI00131419A7|nr:sugar phosphate isomerase/epimerase family protein [Alginatibacterium sediminis]
MVDIAVSTVAYDGYDYEQIARSLQKLNVKAVEVALIDGCVEPFTELQLKEAWAKEIRACFESFGIRCSSFAAHVALVGDDAAQKLIRRIRFAAALGAPHVVTYACPSAHWPALYQQLQQALILAKQLNVRVLIENPGDGKEHIIDNSSDMQAFKELYSKDGLGTNYDPGNFVSHCPQDKPLTDALSSFNCADHFHLKDVLKTEQGYQFRSLGLGCIDYAALLQAMAIQRPNMNMSIELPLRLSRALNGQAIRASQKIPLEQIELQLSHALEMVQRNFLNQRTPA